MYYSNRTTPRGLILLIDVAIVSFSVLLSYLLRFNFNIPESELELMPYGLAVILSVRFILFLISKTFAGIIRYTESQDIMRIFLVTLAGSIIIGFIDLVFLFTHNLYIIPRAIIIIEFISTAFTLASFRMIVKVTYNEIKNPSFKKNNIAIFGAGEAAILTKKAIDQDHKSHLKVVAFIDDDSNKTNKKIENIRIYNSENIIKTLKGLSVNELIISAQNIAEKRKNQISELCFNAGIKVLNVPPPQNWINGQLSVKQIKEINILNLLGRDEIIINQEKIKEEIKGKTILITGAAGSIGSELLKQIALFSPKKIIAIDQAESPMFYLDLEISKNPALNIDIEFHIVNVKNINRLKIIFKKNKPSIVFHAAAYKHVPLMELNPYESVNTNLIGTKNLADLSIEFDAEKFIMVSTDKAVNPTNVMGASKRLAEIYVQNIISKNTKFITTRFGNVLGSNGSVITLFNNQIKNGGPITITHPEVTRYFMTIPEACKLVLEAASHGNNKEIFVFDMGNSVKIIDLAKKMIKLSDLELGKDIQIVYTGLRPGEKLYEEVLADQENTIKTHHPKILKAISSDNKMNGNSNTLKTLIDTYETLSDEEIVKLMKFIIPEYKSENSKFVTLDN